LAADFLLIWFEALAHQKLITKPYPNCRQCLSYADDTLFIIKPEEQQVRLFKSCLKIYEEVSVLQINIQKSKMMATTMEQREVQALAKIMGCTTSTFPFKYLGM
jgi:hypothetical protein